MDVLNNERILNGTPIKAFNNALASMKSSYDENTARKFLDTYIDQPLSFILRNSRNIFSEPYHGYGFYKNIIDSKLIPPYKYNEELTKISDYINMAKGKVRIDQIKLYEDLMDKIKSKISETENTAKIFELSRMRNGEPYIDEFYDALYDIEKNKGLDEREFNNKLDSLMKSFSYLNDPYTFFAISSQMFKRYPNFIGGCLYTYSKNFYKKYSRDLTDEKLKTTLESVYAVSTIYKDDYFKESFDMSNNVNLKYLYTLMASESVDDYIERVSKCERTEETIPVSTTLNLMNRLYEEAVENDYLNDKYIEERYDKLCHKKVIYEFLLDKAILENCEDQAYLEKINDIICDTEAEISFLEWTEDGECCDVIKKRSMTKKEKEIEDEESRKKLEKEADRIKAEKIDDDSESDEKKDNNKEDEIDDDLDEDDTIDDDDNDNSESDEKKDEKKVVKEAGENENEEENQKDSTKSNNDSENNVNKEAETDNDDSQDTRDTSDSSKPVKPKEDLTLKIQNKALDHDAKRKEKQGIRQEKNQRLKNAAKAIASGPKGWIESINKTKDEVDKWDDNRRKEYFIKPGFRKKIFKNMKLALMYGGAAQYKIASIPFMMVLRHFSKEKSRRIRNELARELDTEIRVCEEKINDANSNGDQKEKYRLMRIKDKLVAEKQRVRLNSKYI